MDLKVLETFRKNVMGLLFPKITLTDLWSRKGGALPSMRARRKTKLPRKQLTRWLTSWIEGFHCLSLSWRVDTKAPRLGDPADSAEVCHSQGLPVPWWGSVSRGRCVTLWAPVECVQWLSGRGAPQFGRGWVGNAQPESTVRRRTGQEHDWRYMSRSPVRGECCTCGHEACEIYMLVTLLSTHTREFCVHIFFICYYF